MHYLKIIIPLLLLYLVITANLQPSNVLAGLIIGTAVAVLLRPADRPVNLRRLPGAIWAMARYIVVLIIDIIKSGLTVARIVLTPSLPINPGVVAIPSLCKSELATALSAHAITVTPGELVIEIDDEGIMYTHVLDASLADEYRAEAQRLRRELLQKIFA